MKIDSTKLNRIYVNRVKRIAPDEEFYLIPNASNYAMTNYGRVFAKVTDTSWHNVKLKYNAALKAEAVQIKYDDSVEYQWVSIKRLLKDVFVPDEKGTIYCTSWNPKDKYRYNIRKWCVLSKAELAQVIQNKMNGQIPDVANERRIFFLDNKLLGLREWSGRSYSGIKTRATNPNYKKKYPNYKDVTMSKEWRDNPILARQYFIDAAYPYPGKLIIDKDLMTFGKGNAYEAGKVVALPYKYNNIFSRSTSALPYCIKVNRNKSSITFTVPKSATKGKNYTVDTYAEALEIGRKCKAEYIRKEVDRERRAGYIPDFILEKMEEWADRCEQGLIEIWETAADAELEQAILKGVL